MPTSNLAVRTGEDPWTQTEVDEVKSELVADVARLEVELEHSAKDLHELMAESTDGAGADQADVGSTSLERDAELSLAANQRDLLYQTTKALTRLEAGSYGVCENCQEPIGKMRLMAFPRATLCMDCKRLEERR
ncbi:MAG: TraR/DksA family transcriptional regulator [Actinomycetales bacterium]|nr:TraR/DksA family transcriptional regulator [Actinomycetales bacterium]